MFNSSSAKAAGSKGGLSKSPQKQKAARSNAKHGGRKPTRTLLERLLGKKVPKDQHKSVAEAYAQLIEAEKRDLLAHFRVEDVDDPLHTNQWSARSRRIPKRIAHIIAKFKVEVKYRSKPSPLPKPYIVEWEQRSPGWQEDWNRRKGDSGLPPPRFRQKTHFENLQGIQWFEADLRRGHPLTVEEMMKTGGSQWNRKRAEGALAYLIAKCAGKYRTIPAPPDSSEAGSGLINPFEEDLPF